MGNAYGEWDFEKIIDICECENYPIFLVERKTFKFDVLFRAEYFMSKVQ